MQFDPSKVTPRQTSCFFSVRDCSAVVKRRVSSQSSGQNHLPIFYCAAAFQTPARPAALYAVLFIGSVAPIVDCTSKFPNPCPRPPSASPIPSCRAIFVDASRDRHLHVAVHRVVPMLFISAGKPVFPEERKISPPPLAAELCSRYGGRLISTSVLAKGINSRPCSVHFQVVVRAGAICLRESDRRHSINPSSE